MAWQRFLPYSLKNRLYKSWSRQRGNHIDCNSPHRSRVFGCRCLCVAGTAVQSDNALRIGRRIRVGGVPGGNRESRRAGSSDCRHNCRFIGVGIGGYAGCPADMGKIPSLPGQSARSAQYAGCRRAQGMNNYFAAAVLFFVFLLGIAGVALDSHLGLSESARETFDWVTKVSLGALLSLLLRQPNIQPTGHQGSGGTDR